MAPHSIAVYFPNILNFISNRNGNVTMTMIVETVQMKVFHAIKSIASVHLMNLTAAMPSVFANLITVMEKMTVEIILMRLDVVSH